MCVKVCSFLILHFRKPVVEREDKKHQERWGLEVGWRSHIPFAAGRFFSCTTFISPVCAVPLNASAYPEPPLQAFGQAQHSDVCTNELGVLTQEDLGGWWGFAIALPCPRTRGWGWRTEVGNIRKNSSINVIYEPVGYSLKAGFWLLSTGGAVWAGPEYCRDTVENCHMSLPWT